MIEVTTDGKTEADLEARGNAALRQAMPWLDVAGIKHQLTFSFKLGHKPVMIDGAKASKRQGRVDILVESGGKKLAIVELKRPDNPLTDEDVEQGLSYARVLHPRPPIVIVSNGAETRTYATHTGEVLKDGVPSELAFSQLMAAAMKVAEADLRNAIATLMGPDSDIWMSAVRAATDQTIEEITGGWDDHCPVFTSDFQIPRKASSAAIKALRGTKRVIAVEGVPLAGKTHVLREIADLARNADDMAVLLVEASGTAATGIADEVARLLGAAAGWRVSADEARHWMETLGAAGGPMLVVAVDGLGLEHEAIRRELEGLTAKAVGSRLKFVIEADTSVIDRLWLGETRRKETVFARRGQRIVVDLLDDDEFACALKILAQSGVAFMPGAEMADEYRQSWLLRAMAARPISSPELKRGLVAMLPPLLSLDLFPRVRARFIQDELTAQAATFARAVLDDYARRDRSHEIKLRAMHTFMVRKPIMHNHADRHDLAAMEKSGLVGTVLDKSNRVILTGRIPELIGSELARQIAAELNELMREEPNYDKAADWLVGTCSRLPLGDVIGAQSIIDLQELRPGIPLAFLNRLLQLRPSVQPIRPGTHAVMWLPEIGQLDVHARADGTTVISKPGWTKGIEVPATEGGQMYGDIDSWMILSHLASVRIAAVDPAGGLKTSLVDPAVLALISASPIPLRRGSIDLERSGVHTHDAPDGSSMVCGQDGIVEPVTFSLLRFLEREQENADEWVNDACDQGSAAMLNRLGKALLQLASMDPASEQARWARDHEENRVGPALHRALAAPAVIRRGKRPPFEG